MSTVTPLKPLPKWLTNADVLRHERICLAVVEVTPELAAEWLAIRAPNRNPKAAQIDKIYRAIANKEWLLTHQGIAFSSDGLVIDGQHRLEAIVRAGIPVQLVVAWNLDPKTIRVIDTGTTRTVADVLTILGEGDARRRAADVRCLAEFFTGTTWVLSPTEVQTLLAWCRPAIEWIRAIAERGRERGLMVTPVRAALMLGYARAPEEAQQFCDKYLRVTVAATNEAPTMLREMIRTSPASRNGGSAQAERLLLTLSALRAYFANEPRQLLRPLAIETARAFFKPSWEKMYGPWPLQVRALGTASADKMTDETKVERRKRRRRFTG